MPRKAQYSREEIIDIAFELVRKNGKNYLSTRNIAKALNTSTAPVFTAFSGIDEIKEEIINKTKEFYRKEYFEKAFSLKPVFKSIGLKFIEFAKNEPELFKLIFAGECNKSCQGFMPKYDDTAADVLNILSAAYSLSKEQAKNLYNNLSVYTYGLASLYANKSYIFDMNEVSEMLTMAFKAFLSDKGERKNDT